MADPVEGTVEEIARSRWYVLLSDDEGFSIWNVEDDSETPTAVFDPSEEGSDAAWDHFRALNKRLRWTPLRDSLVWIGAVCGGLWILSALAAVIVTIWVRESSDQTWFTPLWQALGVALAVLPPTFTVIVGLYIVLWMRDHRGS